MNNAGFWPRLMATNIDFLFYLFFTFTLRTFIDTPWIMYLLLGLSIELFEIGFCLTKYRATPGKLSMKMRVSNIQGEKANPGQIILRSLLKPVSLILFFAGFAMIGLRRDHLGLHDLLSGCRVVWANHA